MERSDSENEKSGSEKWEGLTRKNGKALLKNGKSDSEK